MKNLTRDLYLFIAIFFVYFLGRIAILQIFPNSDAEPTFEWLALCWRFDMMTSAYFLLPSAILTMLGFAFNRDFKLLKKIYVNLAIIVSAIIAVINICFFHEYNSQFNYWIFGIFVDDFSAIVESIRQDYPVLLITFALLIIAYIISKITSFVFKKTERISNISSKIKAGIISILYLMSLDKRIERTRHFDKGINVLIKDEP